MDTRIRTEKTLPTGTVAFMFTDVEGSTALLQRLGDEAFAEVLERHNELIRRVIRGTSGVEVATEGDSFFVVYTDTPDAVAAAADIQSVLAAEPWLREESVRVRIGIHTGAAMIGGDNYVGVDVHRAARISGAAHGGQVLLSAATADLVADRLPEGGSLVELGYFRLRDLPEAEALHQLALAGLPAEFPPIRGAETLIRLPASLTGFVGREEEVALGRDLLADHRLVTLTGPGGTGKTRLSIEIARQFEHSFSDGGYFVPLATIKDAKLLSASIIEAIGLKLAGGIDPDQHLVQYLRDKSLLLVLDNLEQLLDGSGVVAQLLSEVPGLKILATSRAPLRILGERELPVPPLPVPPSSIEHAEDAKSWPGVQLFANRATAVRPDFELDDHNVATVTAIAVRLDGLPLAIELAASRIRAMTPEIILERLDNRLLSIAASDLPARQQTIVNAIGWSYDLLDDPTRQLFERCSVFSGSFALSEADVVCRVDDDGIDILEGLIGLAESSLLVQTERSASPRFRMLTVIREYGFAALTTRGEDELIQSRHARTYLDIAEAAAAEILTSKQAQWLERLTADHGNMRAALDWSIQNREASVAQALVAALWRFWQIRGHLAEAEQKAEAALGLGGGAPRARAGALTALAGIRYWQGRWDETFQPYDDALTLFRETGSEVDIAEALYNMSFAVGQSKDFDRAEDNLKEALEIFKKVGQRIGVGRAYWGLGNVASYREDWDLLLDLMARAATELEETDSPFDLGWTWFMTAHGNLKKGNRQEAEENLLEALEIFSGVSDVSALTLILDALAVASLMGDKPGTAARLYGASRRISHDTGVAIGDVSMNQYPELNEFLEDPDEVTAAAYQEGYLLTVDEAIALAKPDEAHAGTS